MFGVLTLFIGCLSVTAWAGSRTVATHIDCYVGILGRLEFVSDRSGLSWVVDGDAAQNLPWLFHVEAHSTVPTDDSFAHQCQVWKQELFGCIVGSYTCPVGNRRMYLSVEYWVIAAPATVISGWLLLRNPRGLNKKLPDGTEVSSDVVHE